MYDKITYKQTKPKVFYDTLRLLRKLNTANKNINKFERATILEPYILNRLSKALDNTAKINIAKSLTQIEIIQLMEEIITDIDTAREIFLFFTQNSDIKYGINFIYETNIDFENIVKQLNGWKKSKIS